MQPRTKAEAGTETFPYVLFAAPPSGSEDYVGEVQGCSPNSPTVWDFRMYCTLLAVWQLWCPSPSLCSHVRDQCCAVCCTAMYARAAMMAALQLYRMQRWQVLVLHSCMLTSHCTACVQVKAALQLWDGNGCFVYTGSAGIYLAEDGSEVREESETSPLGRDERTDRHVQPASISGQQGARPSCMSCWLLHEVVLEADTVDRAVLQRQGWRACPMLPLQRLLGSYKSQQQVPDLCWCRLIKAEQAVLEGQGCVVRLSGLYHAQVSLLLCSDPHLIPDMVSSPTTHGPRPFGPLLACPAAAGRTTHA